MVRGDKNYIQYSTVSSINPSNVSNKRSILASKRNNEYFSLTDFIRFPSPVHMLTKTWCLRLQSWNYAALILNTVLFLSFVMWLRINAESTVSSMRLQCTAIKECLKYRNKCVYVRSFVPKMIHTLCGNNAADILKKYSAFQTNNISESGFTLWKCFLKVFFPNGCITFWNESLHLFFTPNDMFHIYTVCVWFVQ